MGSMTWPVRAQRGTISLCFLTLDQQAVGIQLGNQLLTGHKAVQAAGRPQGCVCQMVHHLRFEREAW